MKESNPDPFNGLFQLAPILTSDRWARVITSLKLSRRECQIIERVLAGADSEVLIADLLGVSSRTVHTHVERMYRKLGVSSRSQLVASLFVAYAKSAGGDK